MKVRRIFQSSFVILLAAAMFGCRGGSAEGWSSRARTMILTNGPSEIVISSSRVPGYWARQAGSSQDFFLYTRARSYKKGAWIKVEGPFGGASAAVFREATGTYLQSCPLQVLVVWKMERSDDAENR